MKAEVAVNSEMNEICVVGSALKVVEKSSMSTECCNSTWKVR